MSDWYLVDPESPSSSPLGPFTREEMASLALDRSLQAGSLVARAGSDSWIPAADDPELAPLFGMAAAAMHAEPPHPAAAAPPSHSRILPIASLAVSAAALICSLVAVAIALFLPRHAMDAAGGITVVASPADDLRSAAEQPAASAAGSGSQASADQGMLPEQVAADRHGVLGGDHETATRTTAMQAAAERELAAAVAPTPAPALPPPQAPAPIEPPPAQLGDSPRGSVSPDRLPGRVVAQTQITAESTGLHTVDFTLSTSANATYYIMAVSERQTDIDLAVFDGARLIDHDSHDDHYPTVTAAGTGGELRFTLQFPADTRRGDKVEIIVRRE